MQESGETIDQFVLCFVNEESIGSPVKTRTIISVTSVIRASCIDSSVLEKEDDLLRIVRSQEAVDW